MWDSGIHFETDEIFRIIHQYQELPADEQIRLARLAQAGDKDARDRLILTNLRLVVAKVKPWMTVQDTSDVIHEGIIGLFEAIKRYDPDMGCRFSSYAVLWIQQNVRLWSYLQVPVSNTRYIHDQARKAKKCLRAGITDPQHIAKQAKISPKIIDEVLAFARTGYVSLDCKIAPDVDSEPFHAYLQDEHDPIQALEDADELASWMAVLSERERQIVQLRFGLDIDEEAYTFIAIGRQLGVSTQRVVQIFERALTKLQRAAGAPVTPKGTDKKAKQAKSEVA